VQTVGGHSGEWILFIGRNGLHAQSYSLGLSFLFTLDSQSLEICSSYCAGSFNGVFVHDTVEVDSLCVTTVKGGVRWGSLTDFFVDHCEFVGSCF
jgi:hypothetical protein